LTTSVQREFCSVIYQAWEDVPVVFTQHLDSKLNNAKSTSLINLKFSSKINFHKNISAKFG